MRLIDNFKCDGAIGGGISFSVVGDHDNRPTDMTNALVLEIDEMYITDSSLVGIAPPLDAHYYLGCGARGVSKGSL